MGVFTNSICLPASRHEAVRATLTRWLAARGFEPTDEPVLFDLDAETERSVFLLENDGWTVVCYSHYEEERRLIHELQGLAVPTLYVWVYDSSAWGFDLFHEHRFVCSWCSDPHEHTSFGEPAPGGDDRPLADPATLCRAIGRPELTDAVATVMRRRAVFREDVCREFCAGLGVAAAMASYDDLECGTADAVEGWRREQLLFVRSGRRQTAVRDLHRQRLTQRNPAAGQLETGTVEVPVAVLEEVRRERRRIRLAWLLLRPVGWLARRWRQLVESVGSVGRSGSTTTTAENPDPRSTYRIAGAELHNERHRCRITLPPEASPAVVSCKPSAVFAFDVDGMLVTCTARRLASLREVLRRPDGARVEHDEKYRIGDLRARQLLYLLPAGFRADVKGPSFLGLHVVESDRALYVFLYHVPRPPRPAVERVVRETVESFRLDVSARSPRAAVGRR